MAPRINLDLDILRTLAVAHDRGGLAQAAADLGRTPSAISLQMKRLQDELGLPIFRKRGRGLALTEAGETALAYARRILSLNDELLATLQGAKLAGQIRIGCPQDFAFVLPPVLSHFASIYPRMQVELHIEGNARLVEATEKGDLDLAVVIGHADRAGARMVGRIGLAWIASPDFAPPGNQPIPLALLGPQCAFRKCALQQLETGQIPHRIAAVSPSLDGLWAALRGKLGITARAAIHLPGGLIAGASLFGLPPLGSFPVTLHRHAQASGAAEDHMASLLTSSLEPILQQSGPPKQRRITREPHSPER
ncbi:LysR substrate-binding domain-containing protein [Silvibacterium dinghuense]|uniref:LysR family transcriptional regulator n=1 Tax=Silvibacterium dinghuense TaxID=1560006 RepID=A0A4Q1SAM1_9BACT|nr:LysR substrate-binding domain-containing protein [Silvibacterium dinghuense]RXS93762.1 LysR family transcriptional regulator [Silvibacterium dinghuense]GGH07405.1 transcriptional regulator [Silvibacterium dinghuense]